MFPAARCFVPLHPQPHATIPCRRAPPPTTVSAKPRRWTRGGPRRDSSWDDDGGGSGGSDSDIDDGFFGQEQGDDDDEAPEREERARGRPAPPAPEGGQLRGSDVLRALQRAAAAKAAARTKKDKRPAARRQGKEKPEGGDVEVGEVRPVVIKPEWAARIRELELRVQQLADKYHHHQ
ncbi:unnamed protein product [Urochloa decumbens]|uniref:Uncharacterized protein n=1 Tax=Urochloa decumbens TaxID=240449 RepID=A0ABC9E498_9POAL